MAGEQRELLCGAEVVDVHHGPEHDGAAVEEHDRIAIAVVVHGLQGAVHPRIELVAVDRSGDTRVEITLHPLDRGDQIARHRVPLGRALVIARLDLLQAGQHLDRQPEVLRHRGRGQLRPDHGRRVDRVIVVVAQHLYDVLCLLLTIRGQHGPGCRGVDQTGRVAVRLPVADEGDPHDLGSVSNGDRREKGEECHGDTPENSSCPRRQPVASPVDHVLLPPLAFGGCGATVRGNPVSGLTNRPTCDRRIGAVSRCPRHAN